jgi:hypothetical protein
MQTLSRSIGGNAPLPGLEPPIIQPVAQFYTTELRRLLEYQSVTKNKRI